MYEAVKELLAEVQQVAPASLKDSVLNLVFSTYFDKLHPHKKAEGDEPDTTVGTAAGATTAAPMEPPLAVAAAPVLALPPPATGDPKVHRKRPASTAFPAAGAAAPAAARGTPVPRH